jgi:single-strand DNA-binding protein
MASINKAQILGRVGGDPEIKSTPSGLKVATFSMATSEKYTDNSGEKVEKTEWHNIVAWKGLADIVERYIKKGSLLFIEGKLTTRSWEDADGKKIYKVEIVAKDIQMLGAKESNPFEPTEELLF